MTWQTYGDVAFYACAVVSSLFVVLYLLFAPWRETVTGRNIMAVMGSLALALVYFAWVIAHGGVPAGFYPMRAMLFTGIATSISWRVLMFVRFHIVRSLRAPEEDNDELEDAR